MDTRMTDGEWNAERFYAARARSPGLARFLDHDMEVAFKIAAELPRQAIKQGQGQAQRGQDRSYPRQGMEQIGQRDAEHHRRAELPVEA